MQRNQYGWAKGLVSWYVGTTLYISMVFSYQAEDAKTMAHSHKKGKVVVGGPGAINAKLEWTNPQRETPYDVLSFHNPLATFTTRGCPNKCRYCAVPKTEGSFIQYNQWKAAPIICDNNILVGTMCHWDKVCRSAAPFGWADFNQGLEARLFTRQHLDSLAVIRKPKVRFAFDTINEEGPLFDAIALCTHAGLKDIGVYVLFGFEDSPREALYRLEKVRSLGLFPNPMRYQPLDTRKRNSYIAPGWSSRELKDVQRFYSMLGYWRNETYEHYVETGGFGNHRIRFVDTTEGFGL